MAVDVALEKCPNGMFFDLSVDHKSDVFEKFYSLRKERILCDVTLHLGNKEIKAHKLLLASSIPYFHSMFTHDLIESRQDSITLKDMDPDSVETIINFVYTSKIYITQKNVQTLLHIATILQVTLVQEKCCEFLENQLDVANCLGIFAYAEMHGCLNLKFKAKNFCDRNFCKVIKEDEFLSLPFERVRWFLDQDELCVRTEAEVVDAVCFWIRHSLEERKDRLSSLLSLVRLHLLSKTYLNNLIDTCSLVKIDPHAVSIITNVLTDLDGKIIPVTKRVPLGLEVIFCMGGYNKRSCASYDCFNPDNGEWRNLGQMPKPKSGTGAVFLGGLLYIIGGHTNSLNDKRDSDTAESYDPFTHEWNFVAKLNTPRHRLGVAVLDGMIYAVGGSDGMIHLNSIERYDIEADKWTVLSNMATRRMGVGVAALRGLLYAVGGFDSTNRLRTVECYCPTKDRWKFVQSMNTPRSGAGVVAVNGHVYALGGYNGVAQLNSVERYCPCEDRWTLITPMNEHRSALSVAVVKNKLFALGGYNGEKFLDSVEVYEPDSGEWQLLKSMPDARSGAGVSVGTIPIK